MPYYRRVGDVPRKRHTLHRDGDTILLEELMGEEGFSGISALLYHRTSPSAIVAAQRAPDHRGAFAPDEPSLPRHLRTGELTAGGDLVVDRHALLGNDDVIISWASATTSSGLYRNAAGDELIFVHTGRGMLDTVFGSLAVEAGDYVVIPRSTTHRWIVQGDGPLACLIIEAAGHVRPPARHLSVSGQLREGAPYSERDVRGPDAPLLEDGHNVDVLVRHRRRLTIYRYANHPFDVVGWDGCLYPWALSIHDFEPIVGRIHQPPPVHQTFEGPGFVVCSFVPRPLDFDADAVKIPYHHANVDSDEVLFYAAGNFTSRAGSGIARGSISLHPAGFVHGPQPGSFERSRGEMRTEELAVMIDTFRPLGLSETGRAVSDPGYPWTWAARS
ncbi:MAG TPA: homogentisate 1,2-dioxygenase [Acidimicrobiales bacterium]|jgi:homogentisate 1,2-dioxygenase|nr:homogentisate 1,2-dioxygenase [Acidimicrobiales bacterium]